MARIHTIDDYLKALQRDFPHLYRKVRSQTLMHPSMNWNRCIFSHLLYTVLKDKFTLEYIDSLIYDKYEHHLKLETIQRLISKHLKKFETLEQFYSL